MDHRFLSFTYEKQTCQRPIGDNEIIINRWKGCPISSLVEESFEDLIPVLDSSQESFFIYAQWKALHISLKAYLGMFYDKMTCTIISVQYNENGIVLRTKILSPQDRPPIRSCVSLQRKSAL